MYFGHYGVGLAFKKYLNGLSLGWLFLATQFVDLLAMTLMIVGIEQANVVPGYTLSSSMEYVHFPYSHSVVAFLIWATVFYIVGRVVTVQPQLQKSRVALLLAVAVLFHFILDVLVHVQDMPILFDESYKLGLGLWNYSPAINYAIEGIVLGVGLVIYSRTTTAPNLLGKYGMIGLIAMLFILNAILISGQTLSDALSSAVLYLILNIAVIMSAFWLERAR